MGLHVQITDTNAYIPKQNLEIAYQKMCALNVTHDRKKRGGAWSMGKQTEKWFSWMDSNYPQTCKDAQAVLEALGFGTEYDSHGNLSICGYDSKTGQEELFMEAIKNEAIGKIDWVDEYGGIYTTEFSGVEIADTENN